MPGYRQGLAVVATVLVATTVSACANTAAEQAATPAISDGTAARLADPRPSEFHGTLLDPPLSRPSQTLRDTRRQPFSLGARPTGELTVLFFGYTHCPDVCPTTMADLAAARSLVPAELRENLAVVFVTEDPQRDTPGALRRWLDRFDTSFVGLRGGNDVTQTMLKRLYLPKTKRVPDPDEAVKHPDNGASHHRHRDYGIEHAGIVYAFGPDERTVIYSGGTTPREYAADFTRLLAGAPQGPDS